MTPIPNHPLRVMVVDDTVTYRHIMSQVVKTFPGLVLTQTASNGRLALARLASDPVDLVFLDVEMPELDGLETLSTMRRQYPKTGVVIVSGLNRQSADITIMALQAGALDFIAKPDLSGPAANLEALRQRVHQVLTAFYPAALLPVSSLSSSVGTSGNQPVAAGLVQTRSRSQTVPIAVPNAAHRPRQPVEVVCIGVSTGGPNALQSVIPHLPANLGVPVLLVQHMPPLFTASLATNLDKQSVVTVKEGSSGEVLQPNVVYIAPGGQHMTVIPPPQCQSRPVVRLTQDPPENGCRPAVDVLFRSLAHVYGGRVLAVIMTGMGSDGLAGVRLLKSLGAACLTQDESSCVVYGMPRAVDIENLSDESIPLNCLAERIVRRVQGGPAR